ncbi:MAG: hypothetical protein FD180_2523 [Planctomycetota bacterium]|nr:MAG: hypothetical protein FD180_2523 [Planctomycetota bacterium]
MECRDCEAKLSWYLDGEAPELEEHLAGCEACRAKLEELRQTDGLLAKAAARFRDEAAGGKPVRIPSRGGFFKWGFLAAAAVALLSVGGWRAWIEKQEPQVQQVTVIGAPTWVEGATGTMRVLVRNGQTQAGIAGAKVVAQVEGGAKVEAVSGADGCADVRIPVPASRDAVLILTVISALGEDRITKKVTIERPVRVLISTDKPIYQPEQTVHLRVLAMDDVALTPFKGEVSLEIEDANGNKVERKALKTSEFGIASLDLDLADEVLLGPWRAKAVAGGVESERVFEVKRYVLPKFRVDLATDQRFYAPGRTLYAEVDANYLFGKPCAGAEVRVTLSHWLGDDFKEAGTAVMRADDRGHARLTLEIPKKLYGTEIEGGSALLRCEAAVTDTAGHVERKAILLPVTAVPIRIVAVPEGGEYVPGVPQKMYIVCSYPDGRPARAWVRFSGQGERQTDESGVLEVPIPSPQFELIARDEDGRSGRLVADLNRDGRAEQDFLLRTDYSQYRTGQTMQVTLLSRTDGPVYLDLTRGAFTYLTKTVEVKNGRADIAIDLPTDLRGSARVAAYRVRADGHIGRDSRPIVVMPAKGLEIRPAIRPEPFKPGDEMTAEIQVFGPDGNPAPSALSVSVVDEAVFALNDSRPGLEATYFAIQEDLLKPRFQLKPTGALASSDPTPARVAIAEKPLAKSFASNEFTAKMQRFRAWKRDYLGNIEVLLSCLAGLVVGVWAIMLMGRVNLGSRLMIGFAVGLLVLAALLPTGSDGAGPAAAFGALIGMIGVLGLIGQSVELSRIEAQGCWLATGAGAVVLVLLVAVFGSLITTRGRESSALKMATGAGASARATLAYDIQNAVGGSGGQLRTFMDVDSGSAHLPPRLREYFPETLYWNPQIVTDDQGRATLRFPGADSITTWRMGMSAVDRGGRLGAMDAPLRVFQPFFADIDLPVALTQGDEMWIPVAVYNYLEREQSVALEFEAESGFEIKDDAKKTLNIAANDVRSVYFHVKAREFGRHKLKVTATSPEFADAIRRAIDVVPDGREMPLSVNDVLRDRASTKFTVPADAVDGASRAWVRLYPSRFSEVVSGLEGLVRLPYG